MKHPRTSRSTGSSSNAPNRGAGRTSKAEVRHSAHPIAHQGGPIERCYRALLEASSSAVLLLTSGSVILEWNRAAEAVSGVRAEEALGRNFVEMCLPTEAHDAFLKELAQVNEGKDVRGLSIPLRTSNGSRTMLSWSISRVIGVHRNLIGLMAIGTPVGSHTQAEEELRLARARVRSETRRAERAAEEERRKIARELHDEFGQALTGLKFDLAWFGIKLKQSASAIGSAELLVKAQAMSGSVDALMTSVRATAASLRPAMLDDLGLVPALECLATTFQHRTGTRCALNVSPELSSRELPLETAGALFRIAQELLTNVMRHAAASHVRMRLDQRDGNVTLEVVDNGRGIAREKKIKSDSLGLRGMQERASLLGGHFHIVGTPGVGTSAYTSVPVAECFTP
jgi:PAS domain S-box-containing protein